jgi:hypothetical protein
VKQDGYTKLVGKEVVPCSFEEWGIMFMGKERLLWQEAHQNHFISTVFLGMDHSFLNGPPLWFESMVFCQDGHKCMWDTHCERYTTYDQAQRGHRLLMEKVKNGAMNEAT